MPEPRVRAAALQRPVTAPLQPLIAVGPEPLMAPARLEAERVQRQMTPPQAG